MAERSWWGRILGALNGEYERRIRAASLVTEYGAAHGPSHPVDQDEGEPAEIVNLPRGARLRPAPHHEAPVSDDHAPGH